jgi:hypothetical protein
VHDSLVAAFGPEKLDSKLVTVALDGAHHAFGLLVGVRTSPRIGRNDVVDGRECSIGQQHREFLLAEHLEGLRAGDFVNQVQADKQLRLPGRQLAHGVRLPNLGQQTLSHAHLV